MHTVYMNCPYVSESSVIYSIIAKELPPLSGLPTWKFQVNWQVKYVAMGKQSMTLLCSHNNNIYVVTLGRFQCIYHIDPSLYDAAIECQITLYTRHITYGGF